jgi:nicotinate-nucleotide pyrophosphorylase (carboxylating)
MKIVEQIRYFLQEDIGTGDLTASIIPEQCVAEAIVVTREPMVVCGQEWFDCIFSELNADIQIVWQVNEGEFVQADTELCRLTGQASSLLTGERTALNLLQTLSAVATEARQFASAVAGTGCKILDTRKTIPGLREALKYAVKCGGCVNHRMGLYDGILIKENHIMATGSIAEAVRLSRKISSVLVEVEVENLTELRLALTAEPDRIMLDNFSLQDMRRAVTLNNGKIELEASGNISLEKVRIIAGTGVDFISVGALTKNLRAIDLSMRIIMT